MISFISTVVNYEYAFYWSFYQVGLELHVHTACCSHLHPGDMCMAAAPHTLLWPSLVSPWIAREPSPSHASRLGSVRNRSTHPPVWPCLLHEATGKLSNHVSLQPCPFA